MKPVIEVNKLSKKYRYGEIKPYLTLRDSITQIYKEPFKIFKGLKEGNLSKDEFWALKDVSFKVNQGEVLGVIGSNGSGKSTLLKILSRITPPTSGKAILRGRTASLLEVGTGFNPELTGRENIFLNGAILGMKRKEIKKRFDGIVEFSGVEKFLDTPVKRYSSGMFVRLAFSVAAHLESEILLVDEVLSVGDVDFQRKSIGKMGEISNEGRTVIFVSHNLGSVKRLCNKVMLLEKGSFVLLDETELAIQRYLGKVNKFNPKIRYSSTVSDAEISAISVANKRKNNIFNFEKPIEFKIEVRIKKPIKILLAVGITNSFEEFVMFWRDVELNPELLKMRECGTYSYSFTIPKSTLTPGNYKVYLNLVELDSKRHIHTPNELLGFKIIDSNSIRKNLGLSWKGLTSIPYKISYKYYNKLHTN